MARNISGTVKVECLDGHKVLLNDRETAIVTGLGMRFRDHKHLKRVIGQCEGKLVGEHTLNQISQKVSVWAKSFASNDPGSFHTSAVA
ncbi:MAG: hypothetical protein KGJ35_02615 [Patescibacteria group bacterium]|nr:hypothetical protein [Patescibacteria group bacterium]